MGNLKSLAALFAGEIKWSNKLTMAVSRPIDAVEGKGSLCYNRVHECLFL